MPSAVKLSPQERNRRIRQVLAWVLVANWSVAIAKLAFGLWSHAAALTADGVHSFIDGSSNVVGLVAMSYAAAPADEDHPYGHGKFEAIASLGIGALVGVGMLELGRMALESLLYHGHPRVNLYMVGVLVITLVINIVITRVESRLGRELQSSLLLADAQHTLSDNFVTIAVLVSMGLVYAGFPRADGIATLVIMGFVARVAYQIIRQSVGILSDSARLDPGHVAKVAGQVDGVRQTREVRSRGMEDSVYVDLKIQVDPALTTERAHALADEVERLIGSEFPQVVDVVVHVEPVGAHGGPSPDADGPRG